MAIFLTTVGGAIEATIIDDGSSIRSSIEEPVGERGSERNVLDERSSKTVSLAKTVSEAGGRVHKVRRSDEVSSGSTSGVSERGGLRRVSRRLEGNVAAIVGNLEGIVGRGLDESGGVDVTDGIRGEEAIVRVSSVGNGAIRFARLPERPALLELHMDGRGRIRRRSLVHHPS